MQPNVRAKEQRAESGRSEATRDVTFTPRVDILETPEGLAIYADMPGVSAPDADVRYERGELTLHGKCPPRHEGAPHLLKEYAVGDYYRAFTIGEEVDPGRITAELKNGVLTVRLPKAEALKPRKIAITGE